MRKWHQIRDLGGISGFCPKMLLDAERYLDKRLIMTGVFEDEISKFVREYVSNDMVCVDVGANIGYYTIILSHLCDEVVAFEPTQHYFDILTRNLEENRDILRADAQCYRKGASNTSKEVKIHIGVCSATINWVEDFAPTHTETISLVTLDEFLKLDRLDLIKIDCDGHDMLVAQGAENLLKRHKPAIIIEVAPKHYELAGTSPVELYGYLDGLGYSIRSEKCLGREISPQAMQSMCDSLRGGECSRNLVCLPKPR